MTRRNKSAGFIILATVELLVVIAIIAILIGLLLPAVQKVRESGNAGQASQVLAGVCQAAQAYDSTNGVYPANFQQFASLINDPTLVQTGMEDGYQFTITEATATAWMAEAEPVAPGATGSEAFTVDQSCVVTARPVPGSDTQRQLMFSQIFAFGAETIAGLLNSNPDALPQARSFVDSPSGTKALQTLSAQSNSGPLISLSSMLQSNRYPQQLGRFLAFLPQAMRLGAGAEKVTSLPGLQWTDLSGPLQPKVFSYQGVCGLAQLYVTNPAVTHSLCASLSLAQAAEERGDVQAKAGAVNGSVIELQAQSGKTLTQYQASVLITLIKAL